MSKINNKRLRQDGSLLPFLFLIVVKGLVDVVTQAEKKKLIDNIEIRERD